MPIQVTCPGCLKRFQVNDKFAGKTGPCPNCSKPIIIPAKSDEVVIHAPSEASPKDAKGRPVFQPIRRQEVRITLPVALTAAALSVISLGIAVLIRFTNNEPPTALLVLGTMLLAPPLVLLGYWFLRDDELDGFTGRELIIRCAIVSVVFVITWGIYAFVPTYLGDYNSLAEIDVLFLLFVVPVMLVLGAVASVLTLELEAVQGVLHYLLYFAVTLILALIMGTQLAQPFARNQPGPAAPASATPQAPAAPPTAPPAATSKQPSTTGNPPKPVVPKADKKPRLMQ